MDAEFNEATWLDIAEEDIPRNEGEAVRQLRPAQIRGADRGQVTPKQSRGATQIAVADLTRVADSEVKFFVKHAEGEAVRRVMAPLRITGRRTSPEAIGRIAACSIS